MDKKSCHFDMGNEGSCYVAMERMNDINMTVG
jgi:hypothetical protein